MILEMMVSFQVEELAAEAVLLEHQAPMPRVWSPQRCGRSEDARSRAIFDPHGDVRAAPSHSLHSCSTRASEDRSGGGGGGGGGSNIPTTSSSSDIHSTSMRQALWFKGERLGDDWCVLALVLDQGWEGLGDDQIKAPSKHRESSSHSPPSRGFARSAVSCVCVCVCLLRSVMVMCHTATTACTAARRRTSATWRCWARRGWATAIASRPCVRWRPRRCVTPWYAKTLLLSLHSIPPTCLRRPHIMSGAFRVLTDDPGFPPGGIAAVVSSSLSRRPVAAARHGAPSVCHSTPCCERKDG